MDFKFFRSYTPQVNRPHVAQPQIPIQYNPRGVFQYEPMRVNRFLLTLPQELNIEPFFVRAVNGPSVTLNPNGLTQWNDFEFTLYDAIGPSPRQTLIFYTRGEMNNNLEFTLEMLDPTGVTVSKWLIYGYIRDIDFGELNYGMDSNCEIKVTLATNQVVFLF
jgi:hypothetical protein